MSNTASTVPGRRGSFIVKGPETDSRLIRRPRKILRRVSLVDGKTESEGGEAFVEREDFHKEYGRGRGFSYVFTGNEADKEWTKSKPIKDKPVFVDEDAELEKLKKERKFAPETLKKTWTPSTRSVSDRVRDPKDKKKAKEDYKKFMNLGTKPRAVNLTRDSKTHPKGMAHKALVNTSEDVEKVAEERRQLLELDRVSRSRIKQLETEINVLEESFKTISRENDQLRSKLNAGDQLVVESYQRVFEDRKILRESETSYKSIIASLESQLRELQKAHDKSQKELSDLKGKLPSFAETLESKAKVTKSYWDGKAFKDENNRLRKMNEKLMRENDELRKRVEKSNPYVDSPRSNKTAPVNLPDIYTARRDEPTRRSYNSEPTSRRWTTSKTHEKRLNTTYPDDPYNMLREDFKNMLPDYFPETRIYKLREYNGV